MKIQPPNSKNNRVFPEGGCSSTKSYRYVSCIRTNKVVPVIAGCASGPGCFTNIPLPKGPCAHLQKSFLQGPPARLNDGWPGSMIHQASRDTPWGHIILLESGHIKGEKPSGLPWPPLAAVRAQTPHLRVSASGNSSLLGPRSLAPSTGSAHLLTRLSSDQGGVEGRAVQ